MQRKRKTFRTQKIDPLSNNKITQNHARGMSKNES